MTFSSCADDGAKMVIPGIFKAERHVEDPVVAGAVVACDAGPVESEDHGQPVQADVQVGLVEGAAEKRRINGHHRAQALPWPCPRPR
jgi:hypothetical protein